LTRKIFHACFAAMGYFADLPPAATPAAMWSIVTMGPALTLQ
jgi:hypothetical protein